MPHFILHYEDSDMIFELIHLGQQLVPNRNRASHHFPAEYHGLRLEGTDSHPSYFTVGCKLPQSMLEVTG